MAVCWCPASKRSNPQMFPAGSRTVRPPVIYTLTKYRWPKLNSWQHAVMEGNRNSSLPPNKQRAIMECPRPYWAFSTWGTIWRLHLLLSHFTPLIWCVTVSPPTGFRKRLVTRTWFIIWTALGLPVTSSRSIRHIRI